MPRDRQKISGRPLLLWGGLSLVVHVIFLTATPPVSVPKTPPTAPIRVGFIQLLPALSGQSHPAPAKPRQAPAQKVPTAMATPPAQAQESRPPAPEVAMPAPRLSPPPAAPPPATEPTIAPSASFPAEPPATSPADEPSVPPQQEANDAQKAKPGGPSAFLEPVPLYERNPAPIYPRLARQRGWQGEVLLRVSIAADGQVRSLDIERSSGHTLLDDAARRTVRTWTFQPAEHAGMPVEGEVRLPIRFELRGR